MTHNKQTISIMKRIIFFFAVLAGTLAITSSANAQIFKKIKKHVKHKAVQKADHAIDKAVDKIGKGKKKKDKKSSKNDSTASAVSAKNKKETGSRAAADTAKSTLAEYKNYDFVPGDKVIFQSNFKNQRDAALPARLGIYNGAAEVETYKGDKALLLEKESDVTLAPLMKNSNYLPDQFTVEFDLLYNGKMSNGWHWITVRFAGSDATNKELQYSQDGMYYVRITNAKMIEFGNNTEDRDLPKKLAQSLAVPNTWHHIAIYIHNNIGKVYIDQYRVAVSNILPKGVTKLGINTTTTGRAIMIKNLRIAAGGSDAYQKIITDGKLVTHGIHFAFGKADILPESMGTINEMYNILKNHTNLNLEINGYTDNVGSDKTNLKLSKQRAANVKAQLVKMGIDASRLTTQGFGEQNPIDSNSTPEGRANNRRVEFVKISK